MNNTTIPIVSNTENKRRPSSKTYDRMKIPQTTPTTNIPTRHFFASTRTRIKRSPLLRHIPTSKTQSSYCFLRSSFLYALSPVSSPHSFRPNFLCSVFSAHLSSTLFPSLYSLAPFIHYASRGFRFFFFQFFITFPASPARFVPPPYASSHIFLSSFCPFMLLLSSLLPRIDIFSVDRPL